MIYAGKGNDRVDGGADNDTIYGRAGDDVLRGGSGNDKVFGDTGNDHIYGDAGDDQLAGGSGMDIFFFALGDGSDSIADFTSGEDHINLHATGLHFSDLMLTTTSAGLTVHYGASQIFLAGVTSVSANDFVF